MEKDLFPSRGDTLRLADFAPPADRVPDAGCDCGGDEHDHRDHRDHHDHHDGHGGCGYGCVGYEGCGPDSWGLCEYPLAMVYAPCQTFRGLYDPDTALSRGTLFTELDLPLGKEGCGLIALNGACRRERRQS